MNKSVLVTGVAGSGKSTICNQLAEMGYKAYGIEDMDGLFKMIDVHTGEVAGSYDNDDLSKVKKGKWICDVRKIKALVDGAKDGPVFCCGIASNLDEITPLFDTVVLLIASPGVLQKRLSARRPGEFGRTKEIQDWLFSWKEGWENELKEKGAVVIDADGEPEKVTKDVLRAVGMII